MHDYEISYGDAAFEIRREFPDTYGSITAADITVENTAGTEIVAATATTVPTATTISADSTRGTNVCTVTAGTWEPNDLIMIADSDDGGAEIRRVKSFDSATKIVTVTERWREGHKSGTAFSARWCTYSLNASSATNYSASTEGYFQWDGFNTDDLPLRSSWTVGKFTYAPGDLQDRFRMRYPHYAEVMPENSWDEYYDAALDELVERFQPYGKDFSKLVNIRAGQRLLLAQIAYLIAIGQGDGWEYERDTQAMELDRLETQFRAIRNWTDDDEDGVRDENEWSPVGKPLPRRYAN
jgi:hypothetical protein